MGTCDPTRRTRGQACMRAASEANGRGRKRMAHELEDLPTRQGTYYPYLSKFNRAVAYSIVASILCWDKTGTVVSSIQTG